MRRNLEIIAVITAALASISLAFWGDAIAQNSPIPQEDRFRILGGTYRLHNPVRLWTSAGEFSGVVELRSSYGALLLKRENDFVWVDETSIVAVLKEGE